MTDMHLDVIDHMKHAKVANYALAGVDSYLIGGESHGKVRLFESSRDQQDAITPHSHRFDFTCLVLAGAVTNRVWTECRDDEGDFFESSVLNYHGTIGEHTVRAEGRSFWRYTDSHYRAGASYSMCADEVHSIIFGRGSKVLFFEGPEKSKTSLILEPVVNGEKIPTYLKARWMFQRA